MRIYHDFLDPETGSLKFVHEKEILAVADIKSTLDRLVWYGSQSKMMPYCLLILFELLYM